MAWEFAETKARHESETAAAMASSDGVIKPDESKFWGDRRELIKLVESKDAELKRLDDLINHPEVNDFLKGVRLEAAHQIERWGTEHDAGKDSADWYWLVGYLGGKALYSAIAGDVEKFKHHAITAAAALLNWHASLTGRSTAMRPGIKVTDEVVGS